MDKLYNLISNPLFTSLILIILFLIGISILKLVKSDFNTNLYLKGHVNNKKDNLNNNLYEKIDDSCPCGTTDEGNCKTCA
mgnify:CR=1 FL=1